MACKRHSSIKDKLLIPNLLPMVQKVYKTGVNDSCQGVLPNLEIQLRFATVTRAKSMLQVRIRKAF